MYKNLQNFQIQKTYNLKAKFNVKSEKMRKQTDK